MRTSVWAEAMKLKVKETCRRNSSASMEDTRKGKSVELAPASWDLSLLVYPGYPRCATNLRCMFFKRRRQD